VTDHLALKDRLRGGELQIRLLIESEVILNKPLHQIALEHEQKSPKMYKDGKPS